MGCHNYATSQQAKKPRECHSPCLVPSFHNLMGRRMGNGIPLVSLTFQEMEYDQPWLNPIFGQEFCTIVIHDLFLTEIPTTREDEAGVNITLIAAVAANIAVICAVLFAVVVTIAVVWNYSRRRKNSKRESDEDQNLTEKEEQKESQFWFPTT